MTHRRTFPLTIAVGGIGALALSCLAGGKPPIAAPTSTRPAARVASKNPASGVKGVQIIRETGGRVEWSHANNKIVLDQQGADRLYDVYTMNPDGTDLVCLTCDKEEQVPQGHNGNPEWHPSGKYIIFQAEKRDHPGKSVEATPGFGRHCDIWMTDLTGSRFWQLTNLPKTKDKGILHPHFSHDGKMLSWTEMKGAPRPFQRTGMYGYWELKVADFTFGPQGPKLSNIRTFEPGGEAFYENHGFSLDGRYLLYTCNARATKALDYKANDIYRLDVRTGEAILLAEEGYNEHAKWSPNGKKVLYMSSAGNRNKGCDYWLMNPDGTDKKRLTYFNGAENPINRGKFYVCSDAGWSEDGRYLLAFVQTNIIRGTGVIAMIELDEEVAQSVGVQ